MMQVLQIVIATFLVIMLAENVNGDAKGSPGVCNNPKSVDVFAASFYAAMVVSHNPNVIDTLTISGGEAGMIAYNVVKKMLEENGKCYADEEAFVAGRALASAGQVTLPLYFNKAAYTLASSLLQFGVLDCSNALDLSLEFYGNVRHEMKGMDEKEFESYVHGIVYGAGDVILAHGKTLDDATSKVLALFYKSFQEDKNVKKTCQFNSTSGAYNSP